MLDDHGIISAYNEGRQDYAFNLIVRKYSERLYWHIRKMVGSHDDADDLLQDTLVKTWKYLPGFREESNLYTWLYRIATNETLNFLRKRKLKHLVTFTDETRQIMAQLESDPYFNGDEIQRKLYIAIRRLPPRQKAVFTLRYFEEMKFEEMTEVLGGTAGSLKASYHHAHMKVRESMQKDD